MIMRTRRSQLLVQGSFLGRKFMYKIKGRIRVKGLFVVNFEDMLIIKFIYI